MVSVVTSVTGVNSAGSGTQASTAGDIFIAIAFRDGSTTAPTAPAGWTVLASSGANTCSMVTAYIYATGATTAINGTWTNATGVIIGQFTPTSGSVIKLGGFAGAGAASTTVNFPAVTSINGGVNSNYIGGAFHRSVDTTVNAAPGGMTNITSYLDATNEGGLHWTNGTVASWSSTNQSVGGTSSGHRSIVVELLEWDPAAMGAIAIDGTTPAKVSNTTNSVTTASFTAPSGALLVAMGSSDANGGTQTYTFSDTGTLAWTQRVIQQASGSGSAVIGTAVTTSAVARTVNLAKTVSGGTFALKVFVVTGQHASPIGSSDTTAVTTNNDNTTAITTTANSVIFAVGTEWENLGAPSSSDMTFEGASGTGVSQMTGYRFVGAAGAKLVNFNAAATGTADWDIAALEILASAASNKTIDVDAGSYALTGQAVTLTHAWLVDVTAGSYALTGQDVTLTRALPLVVDAGSYALTGQAVTLTHAWVVDAEAGSYTLTGADVSLQYGKTVNVDAGSYALTGQDVTFNRTYVLGVDAGAYALTGDDVSLVYGYAVDVAAGAYTLSGQDVDLEIVAAGAFSVIADAGSYALTGDDVELVLLHAYVVDADAGSYEITGSDVELEIAEVVIPPQRRGWDDSQENQPRPRRRITQAMLEGVLNAIAAAEAEQQPPPPTQKRKKAVVKAVLKQAPKVVGEAKVQVQKLVRQEVAKAYQPDMSWSELLAQVERIQQAAAQEAERIEQEELDELMFLILLAA